MPARTRDAVMEGTYGPAPFEVVKLRIRALQQHIDQALVLIDESTDEHEQEEDDLVGSLRRRLFRHGANGSLDRLKLLRHDIMVSKGISSDRLEHNIISAKIDIFRDWMSQVTRRLIQLDRSSSRSVSYLLQAFDLLFQDGIALPTHLDVHHNHPPRFLSRLQRLIDRGVVELDVKEKTVTEIVYRLLDSIHAPLNLEWPVKTALFDKMIRYNTGDPSVILLTGNFPGFETKFAIARPLHRVSDSWCVALALGPPHAIDDTTALSSDLAKCLSNHALAHDLRSCAHRHDVEDAFARHCGRILLGRIESSSSSSSTTSMALSPGHNRLRPIEGLRNDFMSRWRVYRSDWLDGFQIKSFLIIVHMYLISVAPVLALGTLVQHETAAAFEVRDFIMASGIAGIAFHLFAGQPLVIVSSTGPVAMFISMFHKMCSDMHVPFADAYALVGLWAMLFLLVLAAASASILLRQVTRFTDDIFHGIVAVLFISVSAYQCGSPIIYFVFADLSS
uniref:Bicarbonate transporter-like transmembrane domain-containing protein n=2 Tax=Spongospora subterranea TaxID=70186 RepID=A0A0H5QQ87_9EUKA|eukprot:CRZ03777.1 hypothetical protein [Spongospora subterranea]